MSRNIITSAVELAGAVSIVIGVASFSPGAALVTGGVLAIVFGRAAA